MRWTDDRLDDMAKTIEKHDNRLDSTQNLLAAHDLQLLEMQRAERTKGERHFALYLLGVSIVAGQIAQIVTLILAHH